MSDTQGFASKVVGAATQGAVGAVVAASLSSVTEPLVNKVLVERISLAEAIQQLDRKRILTFMKTTMSTNFIKFPFFEATNVVMSGVDISPAMRGSVTGAVFCTLTLPITNYRFRKSMNLPVNTADLYQAYLPTVLRDILYGIVRNQIQPAMTNRDPKFALTNMGRFLNTFITVFIAGVLSAPANELRGYCLQPADKWKPFQQFFQPNKFIRSTSIGATIMALSLSIGAVATPQLDKLWKKLKANPAALLLVAIIAILVHRLRKKTAVES